MSGKLRRMKSKQARERKNLQKKQELDDLREEEDTKGYTKNYNLTVNTVPDDSIVEDFKVLKSMDSEDDPETLEKYYDDEMMPPRPTSFQEVDELHEAQERAHHMREVVWTTQDLVNNILYSDMDPKEQSAKLKAVAGEMESRMMMAMEPMKKDLDVLQIEAILATDARHTGIIEKGMDLLKETLSSAARKKLPAEEFALPEKRKYPIHDKAHVRNALARAAQQMKAGGEGAEDARKALPKIRAAAKRMGIEMGMEKGILIEKDAKGDWRWIGSPTNNFIDWQVDILSKSAHEKYVAFLDANPECAPVFLSWHTPGTAREHPVDFWMEKDGALIMSGILTEDEAAALFTVQKEVDLGMSHQALAMRLDPDPRVVTDYWMYEVSDLPLEKAANPFTSLETMTKEVGMDKLEYLSQIMGSKEKAEAYLQKTSQMQKDLQAAGITSKEKQEESPAEQPAAAAQSDAPAQPPVDVKAIVKQLMEQEFDIEGLNAFVAQAQEALQKVEVLEGLVKELSASSEEQLEKALTPPVSRFAWSQANRPSQSDGTKLKKDDSEEDEELSKVQPGVPNDYWLSQVTGTAPITPS